MTELIEDEHEAERPPHIPPVIHMLARRWKSEARFMGEGFGGLYALVRGEKTAAAIAELITTDGRWSDMGPVTIRQEAWRSARTLNLVSGLPLMVVVDAADDTRFLKVTDFGAPTLRTKTFPAADFRPA